MNKLMLKVPRGLICWTVESSHLSNHPKHLETASLEELRSRVQKMANDKPTREGVPPMGEISFRYETGDGDEVIRVHCFFVNRMGHKARFMRLARDLV